MPKSVTEEMESPHPNATYAELYGRSLMPIFQGLCHLTVALGAEHEPDMTKEKIEQYQLKLQRLISDMERYKQQHFS